MLNQEEEIEYLRVLYEENLTDLNSRNIIMDTTNLDVKSAKENFDCDIYCLGMPNETIPHLKEMIIKNDTTKDWTYYMGNGFLEIVCNNIIQLSKKCEEECKRYNVKFFDTSENRNEKLMQAIQYIEKSSIVI